MKLNWFWLVYLIIFINISFGRFILLLQPGTPLSNYHTTLLPFGARYWAFYSIDILGAIATTISLVPLIRFGFRLSLIQKKFWKMVLIVRILGDLVGHNYEWKIVLSYLHLDFWAGLSCIGIIVLPLIPSYSAHFHYISSNPRNK